MSDQSRQKPATSTHPGISDEAAAMNQKYSKAASSRTTVWKLQPLIHHGKKTRHEGCHASQQECAEAEYFASVSVWGGLNHRLSEFLDSGKS